MKKKLMCLTFLSLLINCTTNDELELTDTSGSKLQKQTKNSSFHLDLAYFHAPVHYQDIDPTGSHGLNGKADYITAYDFDGDFNAKNNWNNIGEKDIKAKAVSYYSVVETPTHYFIIYAFFHPRDWTDIFFLYYFDEHENDLEGILTVIKKDDSKYGKALGIVTIFHSDFYSYKSNNSGLTSGNESIDGVLTTENHNGIKRFKTSAEAKGHGIKAYSDQKPGGNDYVIYYPSKGNSDYPSDIFDRYVSYKLINIFENGGMWDQRFNNNLFNNTKSFHKSYGSGTANAPWNWDDKNDGSGKGLLAGGIAYYPAHLINTYFNGLNNFSKNYTYNPYLGIE